MYRIVQGLYEYEACTILIPTNVQDCEDRVLPALYCTGKMDGPARVKPVKNTKPA